MVKNTKGGSKNKKLARKNINAEHVKEKTRYADPDEPCEMYANVIKIYGGSNCGVMCNDGKERLCVIRKKFRGRHKRGNIIQLDTKVLVGLRDWEITSQDKKDKCDLLEVYKHEQYRDLQKASGINWGLLRTANPDNADKVVEEAFEFGHDDEDDVFDYDNVYNNVIGKSGGDIDIDDI